MNRRHFLARSAAVLAPLVAGCSGDGGTATPLPTDSPTRTPPPSATDSPSPTASPTATPTSTGAATPTDTLSPTPTRTPSPTPTSEAQAAYPDYDWEAVEGVEPTPATEVALRSSAYDPQVSAVEPDTTVTFTNEDAYGHTVTVPALDVARELSGGAATTITFAAAGTYDYLCEFHPPTMVGRIVVSASD